MFLERLTVENFRNLKSQQIKFSSPVTFIVGKNGQGKTSILEAAMLLALGRSFRTSLLKEATAWHFSSSGESGSQGSSRPEDSRKGFAILGEVASEHGSRTIEFRFENGRKSIKVNGNPIQSATSFFGQFTAVSFIPEDLGLVRDAPEVRRQFIDSVLTVADTAYVESAVSYQRALRHRNALLKSFRSENISPLSHSSAKEALSHWDEILIETGRRAVSKRLELCRFLESIVVENYRSISTPEEVFGDNEGVRVELESQFLGEDGQIREVEELRSLFALRHEADLSRQKTSIGIHRDDLVLFFSKGAGEIHARRNCSQGQARSLALSLKLGSVKYILERTGEAPVVLLDDVESELDMSRRAGLFRLISDLGCQVLLSTTVSHIGVPTQFSASTELQIADGLVGPALT